jgi:hypothetical protein
MDRHSRRSIAGGRWSDLGETGVLLTERSAYSLIPFVAIALPSPTGIVIHHPSPPLFGKLD